MQKASQKTPANGKDSSMKSTRKMALLSIATAIATMGLKFGAYFATGSVSLLSDALEAIVNLAAGLVAFAALTIAEKPADARHAYGHDKAEYFASGVEGVLILIAAVSIMFAAWNRLQNPVVLENLGIGILVGVLAAAMNFAASHVMLRVARQHDSITIEADALHLLTDVWTSVGVLSGLLIIVFFPSWQILDPLIAFGVGIHIIVTGMQLLRRTVDGLMDAALSAREIAGIRSLIEQHLPADARFRNLRTRKSGPRRFIEFHLLLPGSMTVEASHAICDCIEQAVENQLRGVSVTIHVEPIERAGAKEFPT